MSTHKSAIYTHCFKCACPIEHGDVYVSLVYHTEYAESNEDGEVEITVKEAEEVISLCARCGRIFNPQAIAQIIKAVPLVEGGSMMN